MKRVLVAAFALVSMSASAQKGSVLLYGNLNVVSVKDGGSSFGINPGVGYQFNDNWTAGVDLGVNSWSKERSGLGESVTGFKGGLFARYTKTLSNIFSIYGQGNVDFLSRQNITGTDALPKGSGVGVNLFPAVFVNVKNGFGLNFDFGGIGFNTYKPKGGTSGSAFNLNFGQTFNVGVSKNFGKRK